MLVNSRSGFPNLSIIIEYNYPRESKDDCVLGVPSNGGYHGNAYEIFFFTYGLNIIYPLIYGPKFLPSDNNYFTQY